jgi:hypothetical protein
LATFNGWNIIVPPSYPPAPASIEWDLDDVVGAVKNPFNLMQQNQDFAQSTLRGSVSYPFMRNQYGIQWRAFLAALRGVLNVFQLGDPLNQAPQNLSATGGTVSGSGQTGFILNTSSSGLLYGDWIQIGYRLYLVTSASGGTLGIWPPIRESPAGGTAIQITNTQGLFRLTSNSRKLIVDRQRFYTVTFEIEEAL